MAVDGVNGSSSSDESMSRAVKSVLGKDDFLKLLMTQLKYQDPLEPTDNKDFIAQMAQFSSLEQMTNMSKGFEKLASMQETLFRESAVSQAINLIGKKVEALLPDQAEPVKGVVQAMKIVDGEPMVMVAGKEISLGYISTVHAQEESAPTQDAGQENSEETQQGSEDADQQDSEAATA